MVASSSCADDGKLDSLETHQSLSNIVVRRRVNHPALRIAEEFIQRIVGGTLSDLVVVVQRLLLVDGVVNWAICGTLGSSTVEASGGLGAWMLLAILSRAGVLGVIITTCCSSESLQVSDNCSDVRLKKEIGNDEAYTNGGGLWSSWLRKRRDLRFPLFCW
jgi:hypothetical protein